MTTPKKLFVEGQSVVYFQTVARRLEYMPRPARIVRDGGGRMVQIVLDHDDAQNPKWVQRSKVELPS